MYYFSRIYTYSACSEMIISPDKRSKTLKLNINLTTHGQADISNLEGVTLSQKNKFSHDITSFRAYTYYYDRLVALK